MSRVSVLLCWGFGAVALAALGLFVAIIWALWPLPDASFNWKPHYERILSSGDCKSALSLLTYALNTYEVEAAQSAAAVGANAACSTPDLLAKATHLAALGASFSQGFENPQIRERFEKRRATGWRRHWNDPGNVWFFFTKFADDYVTEHPSALGLVGAPFAALGRLHCDFSLFDGPQGAYFLMRIELASDHGYDELRLPVWERRAVNCWDEPAQAGYLLYRPRPIAQSQTPEQPKTPQDLDH